MEESTAIDKIIWAIAISCIISLLGHIIGE